MTELARVYGQSLYELALDDKLTGELLGQLDMCVKLLRDAPDYVRLLSTPALPKETRRGAVDESFGKYVHPYVTGFMKLLVDRGAVGEFQDCVRAYRERYNEDNGILEVHVTTAVELTGEAREKLLRRLDLVFGKKIVLNCVVDPEVLGGMRLECAGKRYDGTVRDRLDRIERGLRDTVL